MTKQFGLINSSNSFDALSRFIEIYFISIGLNVLIINFFMDSDGVNLARRTALSIVWRVTAQIKPLEAPQSAIMRFTRDE